VSAVAFALVTLDVARGDSHRANSDAFQQLVGGLGFGPALDLSQCEFSFDPRVCGHCASTQATIAGGMYLCPHHACSIFFYPTLDGR
jgi:hypothetical protein